MSNFSAPPPRELRHSDRTTAIFIHLSTFLKWIFPLGGILAPVLIWQANRNNAFVYELGRQAINFQLSILIYKVVSLLLAMPFLFAFVREIFFLATDEMLHDSTFPLFFSSVSVSALVIFLIFISLITLFDIICTILAATKASGGQDYKYPLSIPFIRAKH